VKVTVAPGRGRATVLALVVLPVWLVARDAADIPAIAADEVSFAG